MKITNERINGLLPQDHTQKTASDRKAFEDALTQQLGQSQSAQTATLSGPRNLEAMLGMGGFEQSESVEDALLAGLFTQTEELLGEWESYAKSIGAGQDKTAWNLLSGIDSRVKALRGETGNLGSRGENLDAVLNELEVLAATEKFKLNRGDYQ